jgi:hypothetical protein
MLTKEEVRYIREHIPGHPPPVLSLYVDVNPANQINERKAWQLRAKKSVDALKIPQELQEQIIDLLEEERPHARTLVLFAAEEFLRRYDLQVELPVVDLAHGRVEARWGKPYVTPLLYALDEYERAGVLWLHPDRWRFYEVFLGEIQEDEEIFRSVAPEEWRELKKYDLASHLGVLAARPGSHRDQYKARVEAWAHRYYERLGHLLEHALARYGVERLVLLGQDRETAFFEQLLPRSLRNRVKARLSDLPDEDASPGMVLEKVAPALEAAERKEEEDLLDQIRNQPGVWGLGPTLDALQEGRVAVLGAPWQLETHIWRCSEGWVGDTGTKAHTFCPDEQPKEVALKDVIDRLAVDFGTRLEFLRGQPEQTLLKELGGLAGLLRW